MRARSSVSRRRAAVLAVAALGLGVAVVPTASAASGVFKGTGTDRAGDARPEFDLTRVDVAYGQATGTLRATIRTRAKPAGDVDVLVGRRQPSGACGLPFVTLRANAATGTGAWLGSGGRVRAKARVTFAAGATTVSVTDAALKGRTPNCATVTSYGAGSARALRDTLDVFDVTDETAGSTGGGAGAGGTGGGDTGGGSDTGDGAAADGVDTDMDGIKDDFDLDGKPDDFDEDGIPDALQGGDTGSGDGSDTGEDGSGGAAPQVSVKVYGIPRRLRRGRSYEARIRLVNDGEADATRLRVRLTRRAGVAISRRVARVSRVRSGKAITVHVRVRLTSRRAVRTVPISVTGEGVSERITLRLRRRGAR